MIMKKTRFFRMKYLKLWKMNLILRSPFIDY